MENPVLSFFLLMFGIPLNPSPDVGFKQSQFSKTLLKEGFKFVSNKGDGIITFNLSLVLLLLEVNLILKK